MTREQKMRKSLDFLCEQSMKITRKIEELTLQEKILDSKIDYLSLMLENVEKLKIKNKSIEKNSIVKEEFVPDFNDGTWEEINGVMEQTYPNIKPKRI